jgi:hypothetical protein
MGETKATECTKATKRREWLASTGNAATPPIASLKADAYRDASNQWSDRIKGVSKAGNTPLAEHVTT